MAQSLRRPVFQCIGLSSSISRRQFSQISPRWGPPTAVEIRDPRSRENPGKSMKMMRKEAMASGDIPSDLGLLPEMYVPQVMKLSTLFTNPRKFLKIQYAKTRSKTAGFVSLLNVKWSSPHSGKRWYNRSYKLQRGTVGPIAMGLHTEMYSAFAAADLATLNKKCTDGILENFRARIAARKRGEVWKWELLKYNGTPKVVAERGALVPHMEGTGIRQAIVRIASKQKLTREIGGKVVEGTGESKDVLEYLVVQQMIMRWQVESWKVWGTTQETTMKELDDWKKRNSGE